MNKYLAAVILCMSQLCLWGQVPVTGLSNTTYMKVNSVDDKEDRLTIGIELDRSGRTEPVVTEKTYVEQGGVKYYLRESEELSGESGGRFSPLRYLLRFGPVPVSGTVDLVVSADRMNYRIWDIDLTGDKDYTSLLPVAATDFLPDTDRDLPEPVLKVAETTVNLHVLGLKPGFNYQVPVLGFYNPFSGGYYDVESASVSETDLVYKFTQFGTTTHHLKLERYWNLYITTDPGETVDVYLDMSALNLRRRNIPGTENLPYVYFRGAHAGLNYEHAHSEAFLSGDHYNYFIMSNPVELTGETTPVEFIKDIVTEYQKKIAEIDSRQDVSHMMKQFQKAHASVSGVNVLGNLDQIYRMRRLEEIRYEDHREIFEMVPYFNGGDPYNLYSYHFFMGYLPLGEKAREYGATDILATTSEGYGNHAALIYPILAKAERLEPLTDDEEEALEMFPEFYRETYHTIDEKIKAARHIMETSDNYKIMETPDVEPEDIIEHIVARHKGSPILIDLWATWCGPCLNAMRVIRPLKEEMKENNVAMIFITDESSPKTKWSLMLPDIGGIHYYLTAEQWKSLSDKYGITGIPAYLLFDRSGILTDRFTGFPGPERMKEALGKIW